MTYLSAKTFSIQLRLNCETGSEDPIFGANVYSKSDQKVTDANKHFFELNNAKKKNWIQRWIV